MRSKHLGRIGKVVDYRKRKTEYWAGKRWKPVGIKREEKLLIKDARE